MDILYELSYLFYQDAENLKGKDPEYRNLKSIEGQLLEQVAKLAGEELRGKLIDAQTEIAYRNFLNCFLCGLRTGFAVSDLGQCL